MNRFVIIFLFFISFVDGYSQKNKTIIKGKITYLSSQNIYVKFSSTEGIKIGDTLYTKVNSKFNPVIKVKYISSKSCSGNNLTNNKFEIGTTIFAFIVIEKKVKAEQLAVQIQNKKSLPKKKTRKRKNNKIGNITGRFSISSYGNISSIKNSDFVRWRYTLSAQSKNFRSSNFSFDSYISFNYRSTEWNYIKNNISDALKIYSFAVNYKFSENLNLTLGRKINRTISNIGAIDGLQIEGKFKNFTTGIVVGSRPDFFNYNFNMKLFEFGGFISHNILFNSGSMQNSLALFQQTNNSKIDRRFLYFQHSSYFAKQFYLFLSTEIDLYKRENSIEQSDFSLTGLFASLRYQPFRVISLQTSYDSRKNVIYYETFQNYTDSLFENATRQGLRFRVNIRPINRIFINLSYGYRFRAGDIKTSNNYSGNITYSSVPFISGSFSINYNHLSTSYLNGDIYGLRYSRNIVSGAIYSTINLRRINYQFLNGASDLQQTIAGIDFSWHILRHLSLSLNYEGTFDKDFNYGRVFFNITKRF